MEDEKIMTGEEGADKQADEIDFEAIFDEDEDADEGESESDESGSGDDGDEGGEGGGETPPAAQSLTQQQLREAFEQGRSRAQEELLANLGLENPATGRPVKTAADYQMYLQATMQARLENGEVTVDEINKLVEQHPEVQRARQAAAQMQEERINAMRAAESKRFLDDFGEITKLDPEIKSIDNLKSLASYPQILAELQNQKRPNILAAFKAVEADRLAERARTAQREHSAMLHKSKSHLTATKARGQGLKSVPRDELEMFRALNPDATTDEITNYYNAALSR
ncbi:MAG: hypothetical protein LBT88_06615 [Oscillospiraceae bacterium]|nr:hypothetical protein [Oscillospiraceae bacterium]